MEGLQPQAQPAPTKKPKGKLELLNEFKKLLEKNGHTVSDEILLAMFQKIETKNFSNKEIHRVKLESSFDRQVIQVFPRKKVYIEKYQENVDFNDALFDDMIKNFNNPKLFKPYVDRDHKLEESYADIVHLFKTEDGLFAEIQLNDLGVDAVKNNKFKYISPEWGSRINTDKEMCKNVLWAITLTNVPALEGELPTLQEQIKLSKKGAKMDFEKKMIELSVKAKSYKLQTEVDPAALGALVEELFAVIDEQKAKFAELMGAKEEVEQVAEEAQAQLLEIKKEKEESEKELFINQMLDSGQLQPADKDLWVSHYDKDKDFTIKYLSMRPKNDNSIQLSKQVGDTSKSDGLDEVDYHTMKQFNLDRNNPEDVRKYKLDQGMEV